MSEIDVGLVEALIAEQFPCWSHLPVAPVLEQGWDNRTFRLGDELSVRLPSAAGYAAAIEKEDAVLPALAAALSTPVPEPVATGVPSSYFPFPWSVRRWLPGQSLSSTSQLDEHLLAHDLAGFLAELHAAPTRHAPAAGRQSFFRGSHPSAYSDDVEQALDVLTGRVDVSRCREVWLEATTTVWHGAPVWVHGDVSPGNLLVEYGRLSAVLDFGCCALGDPACDLAIAWTLFTGPVRRTFEDVLDLDVGTWQRARGWALWKALVTMAGLSSPDPSGAQERNLTAALEESPP